MLVEQNQNDHAIVQQSLENYVCNTFLKQKSVFV
jgi:hypothetical protein